MPTPWDPHKEMMSFTVGWHKVMKAFCLKALVVWRENSNCWIFCQPGGNWRSLALTIPLNALSALPCPVVGPGCPSPLPPEAWTSVWEPNHRQFPSLSNVIHMSNYKIINTTKFRWIGHPVQLLLPREPSGILSVIGLCLFLHQQHNVTDLQEFNSSVNLTVTESSSLAQSLTLSY